MVRFEGSAPGLRRLRRPAALCAVSLLGGLVSAAWAQEAQRPVVLQPYASIAESLTDNVHVSADKQSDLVTTATGGLSVRGRTAFWQGSLDASLSRLQYVRAAADSHFQTKVDGWFLGEMLDRRATIEGGLNVSKQALSPFGATVGGSELSNANKARTVNWRLGPTFQGPLGRDLKYVARYNASGTTVSGVSSGDSVTQLIAAQLTPYQSARLGWSLDATRQNVGYKVGRSTQNDRVIGQLSYGVDPLEWSVLGRLGREYSNVTSVQRSAYNTWGVGTVWTPGPRTRLDANLDHRYFGRSYQAKFEHRLQRSVWQMTASRDVSAGSTLSAGSYGTAYDLFNLQLMSVEPDPVRRAEAVLALLQRNGLSPLSVPDTSLLASAATLTQRVEVSWAWRGLRDTAVVKLGQSNSHRADALAQAIDLLAESSRVRTQDLALVLNHRLTPESNLGLDVTLYNASGASDSLHSFQRLFNLSWSTTLGPHVTGALGLRHAIYLVHPSSYTESALTATLGARF